MFRGTTARIRFALLAAALLAFQLFALAGSFASAHTLSQTQANAKPGTTSPATAAHEGAGSAACAREHPLITGRAAGADAPGIPGTVGPRAPKASRPHTPAALQVFPS
ncbi:hypothetical protein [Streptomyces monashensis]|uniref:Chaplin domain-containing protein n=1 Tax=Streptomyces monashensis TaxID=1678012 RepID=A0A1S2QJC8_9ACTN|nr:hypothetical protein [Streptomyces monashensis]OIK06174.1 hypothetical protein BIV23_09320 [Streptomyces monashensis]